MLALTMLALLMLVVAVFAGAVFSCTDRFPSSYVLELPNVPAEWVSILGEPNWRIEWYNPDGQKQINDYPAGETGNIEIDIPVTWTNPVTAFPFWPAYNLLPGIFKPCGALFPFDIKDGKLHLSWKAGVDSIYYQELVFAYIQNTDSNNETRIPVNFDWPRFRELFESDILGEAVRRDPWLVDWRTFAERTISSNFDRRRIIPEAAELKTFPVPAGSWHGVSPFSKPIIFAGGVQPVFPVRPGLNVWVSQKGILRVNGNSWVFNEIRN